MLQVDDDEEWLAADSADDDEDNTRYATCHLYSVLSAETPLTVTAMLLLGRLVWTDWPTL